MSRRWTLHVHIGDVVGVKGFMAQEQLRRAGLKPLWLGTTREWTVDRKHAADVVAALEHCGAALHITGEDITREMVEHRDEHAEDGARDQFALDVFGDELAIAVASSRTVQRVGQLLDEDRTVQHAAQFDPLDLFGGGAE